MDAIELEDWCAVREWHHSLTVGGIHGESVFILLFDNMSWDLLSGL